MIENQKIRPAKVIGPLGEPLTLDTLPPPETTRWVVRRKAEVVAAVNGGLLRGGGGWPARFPTREAGRWRLERRLTGTNRLRYDFFLRRPDAPGISEAWLWSV